MSSEVGVISQGTSIMFLYTGTEGQHTKYPPLILTDIPPTWSIYADAQDSSCGPDPSPRRRTRRSSPTRAHGPTLGPRQVSWLTASKPIIPSPAPSLVLFTIAIHFTRNTLEPTSSTPERRSAGETDRFQGECGGWASWDCE